MTLSRGDVDHVATLARLGLTDAEKDRLLGELEAILDHIERLQNVDTSALAETAQVGDLVNVMRADEPEEPIGAAAALRNAPATDGSYFVVGAIQGTELDA
ncbi:MAG: Asp-tRNA(Asn)/Glu-tRNA(Gln) amidotransferase subunit GatC [Candidatus Dormiibacterota bacterium]